MMTDESEKSFLVSLSAFDLIIILVLAFGGLGLFLKSLQHNPV